MVPKSTRPKLVTIVGPTASGKSDLAMRVAQEFDGEIIAADSRTVYEGMDIGTAKPTEEDQTKVKHWGLDLVEPGQRFTVFQFKKYAQAAIADIQKRGRLPILVGGTGLYIDSILFDFAFVTRLGLVADGRLEKLSVEELQQIIKEKGYPMPENFKNKRYLINTITRQGRIGERKPEPVMGVLLVGLKPQDEEIKNKIKIRTEKTFQDQVLETGKLIKKYGKAKLLATAGIAYQAAVQLIDEEINEKSAKELIKKAEWQYARRQKTWFKGNKCIHWFESPEQAYGYIKQQLNT